MPDTPESHDAESSRSGEDKGAAQLARRAREFQVLQRASTEINSTLDLEEIFDAALRTMDELFEFHHAIIFLIEPGGETLRVVASRGYESQAIGGRVAVGTGVVGLVAQKRKMLYVSNLGQQRVYAAAQRRQMVKTGRGAELGESTPVPGLANAESQFAIPLMMRDDLVGVFSIESPVKRTFSEHERGLVSIVANQIASAIHNARLYEERTRAVDALTAANASLESRVAERTAALERELRVAEALLSDVRSRVEGPLLGDSEPVRALRSAVTREAHRSEPLLLVGPPGSGKEAVAHALHEASGRAGAFISVNCPELHALSERNGGTVDGPSSEAVLLTSKLELAAGGTLFLDAVHELPSEFHAPLREILERQSPPGPDSRRPSGARIVASTTRDMTRDPQSGRLDPLFQRLSASRIVVPALADRREDIPAIVRHFVQRHSTQLGKAVTGVSQTSMQRLEAYLWPGNIQELRTVIERAILVAREGVIEIEEELLNEGLAVGSYRLVSPLGSGGMGEVWLAKHRLLARPAAVKLIRHDSARGPQQERLVRRFQREAQVTAGLRSPHTVQLYDFGVNDSGSFYYVMELLNGLDLHKIVTRFGPQPAERVIALMRQTCRSLAEAHDLGLVHRDIKPANLFVTRLGPEYDYVKVLDFGIVKDQPGHDHTTLSGQHIVQGTPAFMAPELLLAETVDGRTDLYSLACTAYWVLTGLPVFNVNTAAQMMLAHVQTKPAPPSEASELEIPPALERVVMRCLEKSPANRVATALALDAELAKIPVEQPWTQERAREWWENHAPELLT